MLFTADHGEQLGEHHLLRKELPYEGSAHIPMFLAPLTGAEVDTPGESDALVTLEDIMPTMLDLAGLPTPDHLGDEDGRSLAPAIEGKPHGRAHVHGACWWRGRHHRYLVRGRWKYVRWTGTGEEELFDVVDDPQELHDRSGEEELADFRAAVDSHRDAVRTGGDDDREAELRPCDNGPPDAIRDGPEFSSRPRSFSPPAWVALTSAVFGTCQWVRGMAARTPPRWRTAPGLALAVGVCRAGFNPGLQRGCGCAARVHLGGSTVLRR